MRHSRAARVAPLLLHSGQMGFTSYPTDCRLTAEAHTASQCTAKQLVGGPLVSLLQLLYGAQSRHGLCHQQACPAPTNPPLHVLGRKRPPIAPQSATAAVPLAFTEAPIHMAAGTASSCQVDNQAVPHAAGSTASLKPPPQPMQSGGGV